MGPEYSGWFFVYGDGYIVVFFIFSCIGVDIGVGVSGIVCVGTNVGVCGVVCVGASVGVNVGVSGVVCVGVGVGIDVYSSYSLFIFLLFCVGTNGSLT